MAQQGDGGPISGEAPDHSPPSPAAAIADATNRVNTLKTRLGHLRAEEARTGLRVERALEELARQQWAHRQAAANAAAAAVELEAAVQAPPPCQIDATLWLPDEMLIRIFVLVPGRACGRVCRRWRALCHDQVVHDRREELRWAAYATRGLHPVVTRHEASLLAACGRQVCSGFFSTVKLLGNWSSSVPLPVEIEDHSIFVEAVAFDPTGEWVFTGDSHGVRAWWASDGREAARLIGHVGMIAAIGVSGTALYGGSSNGRIYAWPIPDADHLGLHDPPEGVGPREREVLEDVHMLANVDEWDGDQNPKGWAAGGDELGPFPADIASPCATHSLPTALEEQHTDAVRALAVVDGTWLCAGSDDTTISVWQLGEDCLSYTPPPPEQLHTRRRPSQHLRTLTEHRGSVTTLAAGRPGQVVSGSQDRTVRVWCLLSGAQLRHFQGHTQPVHCVAVRGDGAIFSGSADATIRLWREGGPVHGVVLHAGAYVSSLALTDDGTLYSAIMCAIVVW